MYKAEFEDSLRGILSSEGGPLYAWAKQPATESETFSMVAEFCDVAGAVKAVQKCNGRVIGVSIVCNQAQADPPTNTNPVCSYSCGILDSGSA